MEQVPVQSDNSQQVSGETVRTVPYGLLRNSDARARVLAEFAACGQITKACEVVGIARDTHYDWLQRYPEYRTAFEKARERAADVLEDEAWRRAHEGIERWTTVAGKEKLQREYSDNLLMFLLKARNRKVFGDRSDDTLKVEGELSIAQILRQRRLKRNPEAALKLAAPAGTPAAAEDGSDPVIDEIVEGMNQPTE